MTQWLIAQSTAFRWWIGLAKQGLSIIERGWAKTVQPLMFNRNNCMTQWLIAQSTAFRWWIGLAKQGS